jgi:hypothetical protein
MARPPSSPVNRAAQTCQAKSGPVQRLDDYRAARSAAQAGWSGGRTRRLCAAVAAYGECGPNSAGDDQRGLAQALLAGTFTLQVAPRSTRSSSESLQRWRTGAAGPGSSAASLDWPRSRLSGRLRRGHAVVRRRGRDQDRRLRSGAGRAQARVTRHLLRRGRPGRRCRWTMRSPTLSARHRPDGLRRPRTMQQNAGPDSYQRPRRTEDPMRQSLKRPSIGVFFNGSAALHGHYQYRNPRACRRW